MQLSYLFNKSSLAVSSSQRNWVQSRVSQLSFAATMEILSWTLCLLSPKLGGKVLGARSWSTVA